jgi:hypothetical protein
VSDVGQEDKYDSGTNKLKDVKINLSRTVISSVIIIVASSAVNKKL